MTGAEIVKTVKQNTIVKCFKKCGILSAESIVVSRTGVLEDPFAIIDEDPFANDESHDELSTLVNEINISPTCSPEEYLASDDLPICDDASDDWDDQFMAELTQNQLEDSTWEDDDDEKSFDLQLPALNYGTYQEAISAVEDLQAFLGIMN